MLLRALATIVGLVGIGVAGVAITGSGQGETCRLGSLEREERASSCWRPFSDSSPFNRKLPADPPRHPHSEEIVQRWLGDVEPGERRFDAGIADTPDDYEHPLYFSEPDDPLYTIRCTEFGDGCEIDGAQVRIPAAARPAAGSDGHLGVIDEEDGWEYGLFRVGDRDPQGGELLVGWGGRTPLTGDDALGLGSDATAAHFALSAGLIRPSELRDGRIDHALFMIVPCTDGTSVFPAGSGSGRACSEIDAEEAGAPSMGAHFYLDMSPREIDALDQPAWRKTVLRAMAEYGMFVGDTGGGFIRLESGSSFTSFGLPDPWIEIARESGAREVAGEPGRLRFDLGGIDWERLTVADPCVAAGTC